MKDFLTALGLVMILEGIPYFLAPQKMREWVMRITELPDRFLRISGFFLMIFGLLTVWWMRG